VTKLYMDAHDQLLLTTTCVPYVFQNYDHVKLWYRVANRHGCDFVTEKHFNFFLNVSSMTYIFVTETSIFFAIYSLRVDLKSNTQKV